MADAGHNAVAPDQLRQFVERAERLHEERQAIASDISDLMKEARGQGFDVKVLKRVLAARRRDAAERQEEDAIFGLYMAALGEAGE